MFKVSASVLDLKKPDPKVLDTGIGFFDHMLDQLNSHAQVGVSVEVKRLGENVEESSDKNRFANSDQKEIVEIVGDALGCGIQNILENARSQACVDNKKEILDKEYSSRFCCPLDEALVECIITIPTSKEDVGAIDFALAPYGIYPAGGRTKIGEWKTENIEHFFDTVATKMGARISLKKIRGHNGHHVVESAFKAFSRALRNLIDNMSGKTEAIMWGPSSESFIAGSKLERTGSLSRKTKETSISVDLKLDGSGKSNINTGIKVMDGLLTNIVDGSGISLEVECNGDLWVDDHHTVSHSQLKTFAIF